MFHLPPICDQSAKLGLGLDGGMAEGALGLEVLGPDPDLRLEPFREESIEFTAVECFPQR